MYKNALKINISFIHKKYINLLKKLCLEQKKKKNFIRQNI